MDLVLSLPASLQTTLFVEVLGEVAPLLQLRAVSRQYRILAERLLARLRTDLKKQELFWETQAKRLEESIREDAMSREYKGLRGKLKTKLSSLDLGNVNAAGYLVLEHALLLSGCSRQTLYQEDLSWLIQSEDLYHSLASLSLFRLSDAQTAAITDFQDTENCALLPEVEPLQRWIAGAKKVVQSQEFAGMKIRYSHCVSCDQIVKKCVRVLIRLEMMQKQQFFPRGILYTLPDKAEAEAQVIYHQMRNLHC